jgi:predicted DsbA family dithiol-disulfide isomerase
MKHSFKVFYDFTCPFSYIGKGIADKLSTEFDIEAEWLPKVIRPEVPAGGENIYKLFKTCELEEMFSHLNETGSQYGISFKQPDFMPNASMALSAGEYAKEKGHFDELQGRIFQAFFTEGKDIGNIDIVLNIVEEAGFNKEEFITKFRDGYYENHLNAAEEKSKEYKVDTTPTFIIDEEHILAGDKDIEEFRALLLRLGR